MRTVTFYFDFISPYAYVAWHRIHPLLESRGVALEVRPVLFAALLDAHGNVGPAEVPAKRAYVFKDVFRKAHATGLPLVPPPAHPFNPLLALRLCALDMEAATRRTLITGLYAATWGGGPGVTDPQVVAQVASAAGLDGAAAVAQAGEPQAKARIKANTDAALAAGVFGVPTMAVDGELFWGVDAMEHLAAFLDGKDPVAGADLSRWNNLPAAVVRARAPRS